MIRRRNIHLLYARSTRCGVARNATRHARSTSRHPVVWAAAKGLRRGIPRLRQRKLATPPVGIIRFGQWVTPLKPFGPATTYEVVIEIICVVSVGGLAMLALQEGRTLAREDPPSELALGSTTPDSGPQCATDPRCPNKTRTVLKRSGAPLAKLRRTRTDIRAN